MTQSSATHKYLHHKYLQGLSITQEGWGAEHFRAPNTSRATTSWLTSVQLKLKPLQRHILLPE